MNNVTTRGTIYDPSSDYLPRYNEFGIRGTLKFDNGGPFTGRFKFSYGQVNSDGQYANAQRIFCPTVHAQLSTVNDCTADNQNVFPNFGTTFGTGGVNTVSG